MSASSRPSLANPRLWAHRRAFYFSVFRRALMLLRQKQTLPIDERNLTRELSFLVVTARRELDPDGRFAAPWCEANNLPDPDSDTTQSHEQKRPDFQWKHDDDAAADDRHREKSFVVECKRLGTPASSTWILNKQYVIGGILRFSSLTHRYGNHMAEGAMIALVQSMEFAAIHDEVNAHAQAMGHPVLTLDSDGWQTQGISQLEHQFPRSFPISPFRLTHLWLDIRDVSTTNAASPSVATSTTPIPSS